MNDYFFNPSRHEEDGEHIYINVVDNGESLNRKDIELSDHIKLFPNHNNGGSGGFARGMIESLRSKADISHVILMDDDVLLLPESIRRTYTLLRVLKPEYYDCVINGAMLKMEDMEVLHEDVGTLDKAAYVHAIHQDININDLRNIIYINRGSEHRDYTYGAWWFNCIPRETIEKFGLPLPVFIRMDDCEYGIRIHAKCISMSGIGIWHMGFDNKFNFAMDLYQRYRNSFIIKALGEIPTVNVMGTYQNEVLNALLHFNYDAVEVLSRAMEDYLKGPEFLKKDRGFSILQENRKLNEKMTPLADRTDVDIQYGEMFSNKPLKFRDKVFYYLTFNGNRWWPEKWMDPSPIIIQYQNWYHEPGKDAYHKNMLALDPVSETGHMRSLNKKRFREVYARYKKCLARYKSENPRVEQEYKKEGKYLTSLEFWKGYLGIE